MDVPCSERIDCEKDGSTEEILNTRLFKASGSIIERIKDNANQFLYGMNPAF